MSTRVLAPLMWIFVVGCGAKSISLPDESDADTRRDATVRDAVVTVDSTTPPPPPRDGGPTPVDAMPPPPPIDVGVDGECTNPTDVDIVDRPGFDEEVRSCALDCVADPALSWCVRDCLIERFGTTEPCSVCFGDFVLCTLERCLPECISDSTADACIRCQCGDNHDARDCGSELDACTGLPASECPG